MSSHQRAYILLPRGVHTDIWVVTHLIVPVGSGFLLGKSFIVVPKSLKSPEMGKRT
jgi:hypothetical protein